MQLNNVNKIDLMSQTYCHLSQKYGPFNSLLNC